MSSFQKLTVRVSTLILSLSLMNAYTATTATTVDKSTDRQNWQKEHRSHSAMTSKTVHSIGEASEHQWLDVSYKTLDGNALTMDIYLPKVGADINAEKGYPLAIWVHGGAWKRGDKADFSAKNPNLAKALLDQGYALASINYRLSNEAQFPAPLEDTKDAVRFLSENAKRYHIDTERMVLMGRSAGGHLAALTATQLTAAPHETSQPTPKAIISFFGLYDLLALEQQKSMRTPASAKTPEGLLLGETPSAVPELAKEASPITFVTANTPPTLLMHGKMDRQAPVEQSLNFASALKDNNVPHQTIIENKAGHSDPVFDSEAYVKQVLAFLSIHNS